jgi:uncharacterized protein DUF3516
LASATLEEAVEEIGLEIANVAPAPPPVTANVRAFTVMVRNAAFRRVELAARRDVEDLAAAELPGGLDREGWRSALDRYFSVHAAIGISQEARAASWFVVDAHEDRWEVRQVFDDPEGWHDSAIIAEIDLRSSDEEGSPAWRTLRVEQA